MNQETLDALCALYEFEAMMIDIYERRYNWPEWSIRASEELYRETWGY